MVQPKTGRSRGRGGGGGNTDPRSQNILQSVDSSKRQKFQSKLEEFQNQRSWSRDSFKQDYKDLNNVIETVEELITDIQTEINRMEGRGDNNVSEVQRIKSDYGEQKLQNLQNTGGGQYTPYLKEIYEAERDLKQLYKRIASWFAYRERLQEIGKVKLFELAEGYKSDFVDSEVADRLLDYQEERQKQFEEQIEDKIESEISNKFARHDEKIENLKERVDEAKQEARTHRRMLQRAIETLSETGNHGELVQKIRDELESTRSSIVQENESEEDSESAEDAEEDSMDVEQVQRSVEQTQERSESSESSLEQSEEEEDEEENDEELYELEGKNIEGQYQVLKQMSQDYDLGDMSQRDIASKVDVSRPFLVTDILDKIEEEYDTDFGIRD